MVTPEGVKQNVDSVFCQLNKSFSSKIFSNKKNWQMRNVLRINARKKRIERNDGSLDQHIVHTIHLPILSFPYIILSSASQQRRMSKGLIGGKQGLVCLNGVHFNEVQTKRPKGDCESFQEIISYNSKNQNTLGDIERRKVKPLLESIDAVDKLGSIGISTHAHGSTSNTFGSYASKARKGLARTISNSNCGTPVQGNLLPLIRQNFWEENCCNLTNVIHTENNSVISTTDSLRYLGTTIISTNPMFSAVRNLSNWATPYSSNVSFLAQQTQSIDSVERTAYGLSSYVSNTADVIYQKNKKHRTASVDQATQSIGYVDSTLSALQARTGLGIDRYVWHFSDKENLELRVSDMHFAASLAIRTIINPQSRYTSILLKLPKKFDKAFISTSANQVQKYNFVYKKNKLNKIYRTFLTGITKAERHILATTVITSGINIFSLLVNLSTLSTFYPFGVQIKQVPHPYRVKITQVPNPAGVKINRVPCVTKESKTAQLHKPMLSFARVNSGEHGQLATRHGKLISMTYEIPEKIFGSLQEIPHTNCFRLMRRILEYPLQHLELNQWVTHTRQKLKYSPFSIDCSPRRGDDKLRFTTLPNVIFEKNKVYTTFLVKRWSLSTLRLTKNPRPIKNIITTGKKQFLYLNNPIYLNWYNDDVDFTMFEPASPIFEKDVKAREVVPTQLGKPSGVCFVDLKSVKMNQSIDSVDKLRSDVKSQRNVTDSIDSIDCSPRRGEDKQSSNTFGVKASNSKGTQSIGATLNKVERIKALQDTDKLRSTKLSQPFLSEFDQITLAAENFAKLAKLHHEQNFLTKSIKSVWECSLTDESLATAITKNVSLSLGLNKRRREIFKTGNITIQKATLTHHTFNQTQYTSLYLCLTKSNRSNNFLKSIFKTPKMGALTLSSPRKGEELALSTKSIESINGVPAELETQLRKPLREYMPCFSFASQTPEGSEGLAKLSMELVRSITNTFLVFPGQLVAYGENITNTVATTESGQVLYIDSQKINLRKAQTVLTYSQAIIAVLSGEWIKKGTPLMALSYQKLVTGDIVQGLPKIEQFFEAPVLKDGTFWSDSLQAKLNQFFQEHREQLPLVEAVRKGFSEIQRVLVEGVQRVYISQGVLIADKHLEVIVRQMTCKGRILYSGDTGFLRNELVSLDKIESVNQVTYGQKALYHPQVRGITDASLESESFLSAASFQETTRVLSRDAIIGKTDLMRGLKERVIVGELIQAGTGLFNNNVYNLV